MKTLARRRRPNQRRRTSSSGPSRIHVPLAPVPGCSSTTTRGNRASSVAKTPIWPERRSDRIVFTIEGGDIGYDSTLEWRIESDDDADEDRIRQLRRRLDELINRDLRLSFGQ